MLDAVAVRARTYAATARRATFGVVCEVDASAMQQATSKLTCDAQRIIRHHYTGGAWAAAELLRVGLRESQTPPPGEFVDLCVAAPIR